MTRYALPLLALLLSACAAPLASGSGDWRSHASDDDRERLRDWRTSFVEALTMAKAAGHETGIAAEGALLEPDSALGGGIPNGTFRCRWIKLGARSDGGRDLRSLGPEPCIVSGHGGSQAFAYRAGVQRPSGIFYPADRVRLAFLGALSLGDETAAMRYGTDPDRDMAGWVERVGEARWRIILPEPRLESRFDVIELVPAT